MKCYCCSGLSFSECCQPYITELKNAPTAEALMRSRYTAFCLKNFPYLDQTQHPSTRSPEIHTANQRWARLYHFTKLSILRVEEEPPKAILEFIAEYRQNNATHQHHEVSEFCYENSRWYYLRALNL